MDFYINSVQNISVEVTLKGGNTVIVSVISGVGLSVSDQLDKYFGSGNWVAWVMK